MSESSQTKSDRWANVRHVVKEAKAHDEVLPHPDPGNLCTFVRMPLQGLMVPKGNFVEETDPLTYFMLYESDMVAFNEHTGDRCERHVYYGRIIAIVVTDGAGTELELPHLALMVAADGMASLYVKFVSPVHIYSKVYQKSPVFNWFMNQPEDFTAENIPQLLTALNAGFYTNLALPERLQDGELRLPPHCAVYVSQFEGVQRAKGPEFRLNHAQRDFELWLLGQGHYEYKGSGRYIEAEEALENYLAVTPVLKSQLPKLVNLASHMGRLKPAST